MKIRSINVTHRQQRIKIRDILAIRWQKIKSTDFIDFTDVAKQKFVIFVLSVGKNKVNRFHGFHRCCKTIIRDIRAIRW